MFETLPRPFAPKSRRWWQGWWPWGAGLGGGLLLLGPGLAPGSLLSLDLVLTPTIPFPREALGLGPELPRRVPLGAALAWVSDVAGGPVAGKVFLLACLAAAFAGAARLAAPAPWPARAAAGALYALGPFAATRVGAGHWAVLAAMAVLPFALPRLLTPAVDPARSFLALAALAVTGVFGGITGATAAVVASRFERPRRTALVVGLAALAQLPWLVPGLLIRGGGLSLAGGRAFAPESEGPLGVVGGLLAQHGFWRPASQVGGQAGTGLVLVGVGLAALAWFGTAELARSWRRPLQALAGFGLAVAAVPSIPGLSGLHSRLTEWAPFAPLRESQRALVWFLVWMAPAAALGAVRLARAEPRLRAGALALPLAAAVALSSPGWFGIGGRLEPVAFPPGWRQAREAVTADPGTVLALPWHQYLNLGFAGQRRVLNPLADYLGGDVVWSHDPELGGEVFQESADPREATVRSLLPAIRRGEAAPGLAALGVRWVVLLHEADWREDTGLQSDPALVPRVQTRSIELFEVVAAGDVDKFDDGRGGSLRVVAALAGHAAFLVAVAVAFRHRRRSPAASPGGA